MGKTATHRTETNEGSSSSSLRNLSFLSQVNAGAKSHKNYSPDFYIDSLPERIDNFTNEEITAYLETAADDVFLKTVVLRSKELISSMLTAFQKMQPSQYMRFLTHQDANGYNALMAMIRNKPDSLSEFLSFLINPPLQGEKGIAHLLTAVSNFEHMNALMLFGVSSQTLSQSDLQDILEKMCDLISRLDRGAQETILTQYSVNHVNLLIIFAEHGLPLTPLCQLLEALGSDVCARLCDSNILSRMHQLKNPEAMAGLLSMAFYAFPENEKQIEWVRFFKQQGGREYPLGNILAFAARLYPDILETILTSAAQHITDFGPYLSGTEVDDGLTPLHLALQSQHRGAVLALLQKIDELGTQQQKYLLMARTQRGNNVLCYAVKYCTDALMDLIDAMRRNLIQEEDIWLRSEGTTAGTLLQTALTLSPRNGSEGVHILLELLSRLDLGLRKEILTDQYHRFRGGKDVLTDAVAYCESAIIDILEMMCSIGLEHLDRSLSWAPSAFNFLPEDNHGAEEFEHFLQTLCAKAQEDESQEGRALFFKILKKLACCGSWDDKRQAFRLEALAKKIRDFSVGDRLAFLFPEGANFSWLAPALGGVHNLCQCLPALFEIIEQCPQEKRKGLLLTKTETGSLLHITIVGGKFKSALKLLQCMKNTMSEGAVNEILCTKGKFDRFWHRNKKGEKWYYTGSNEHDVKGWLRKKGEIHDPAYIELSALLDEPNAESLHQEDLADERNRKSSKSCVLL